MGQKECENVFRKNIPDENAILYMSFYNDAMAEVDAIEEEVNKMKHNHLRKELEKLGAIAKKHKNKKFLNKKNESDSSQSSIKSIYSIDSIYELIKAE